MMIISLWDFCLLLLNNSSTFIGRKANFSVRYLNKIIGSQASNSFRDYFISLWLLSFVFCPWYLSFIGYCLMGTWLWFVLLFPAAFKVSLALKLFIFFPYQKMSTEVLSVLFFWVLAWYTRFVLAMPHYLNVFVLLS